MDAFEQQYAEQHNEHEDSLHMRSKGIKMKKKKSLAKARINSTHYIKRNTDKS